MRDPNMILLLGLAAVTMVLILWIAAKLSGSSKLPQAVIGHIAEPIILATLMCVFFAGSHFESLWLRKNYAEMLPTYPVGVWDAAGGAWAFAWLVLLLARLIRNRIAFLSLSLFAGVFITGWLLTWKSIPVMQEIRAQDDPQQPWFADTVFVSVLFTFVRASLHIAFSTLTAMYFVRTGFSWALLILGSLLGGYAFLFLLSPFMISQPALFLPLAYALCISVMVALPFQRRALERLLGISLSSEPAENQEHIAGATSGQSMAGHGVLGILVIGCALSAFVNYFEEIQLRCWTVGPERTYRSPALVNALPEFRAYFDKKSSPSIVEISKIPDYDRIQKLWELQTSETITQICAEIDRPSFKLHVERLRDLLNAYEDAGKADYVELTDGANYSYLNLREASRTVAAQSMLAMHDGRNLNAITGMKSLYRMGALLNDQPFLVTQMVGSSIRGIGNGVAHNILVCGRKDEQTLLAMHDTMQELVPYGEWDLDFEALKRGELALAGQVLPNFSISLAAFNRVRHNARISYLNFQLIRVASAIELYRFQNSALPETLQDLTPGYMKRLPRDPLGGRNLEYKRLPDGEYSLTCASLPKDWDPAYAKPLVFPLGKPAAEAKDKK